MRSPGLGDTGGDIRTPDNSRTHWSTLRGQERGWRCQAGWAISAAGRGAGVGPPGSGDWSPPGARARAGAAHSGPGWLLVGLQVRFVLGGTFRFRGQRDNQELGLSLHPEVGRIRTG